MLLMSGGILGTTFGAEFDPKNLDAIKTERARIDEKYKDDPVGKTKALKDLTEKIAVANGNGSMVAEQRRLEEKYGSFHSATIALPMGGQAFKIIDHDAWRGLFERNKNVVQATFFLEKTRYANAKPTNVAIQIRTAGLSNSDEGMLFSGGSGPETFRMTLAPEARPNGTYVVSFSIPEDQLGRFVFQVFADIEPSLSTNSVVPIILR